VIILFIFLPVLYIGRKVFLLIDAHYTEERLKKEIIVINAENEMLRRRINDYRRGLLIETRARDDLGMIKKGEKIYIRKR